MRVLKGREVDVKMWTDGVPVSENAIEQLRNIATLPFIFKHVAAMPDVHLGKGATIGSVIPTLGAIIPAAVGVDLGCGVMAVKTGIPAERLPDDLSGVRAAIERTVPHGRTHRGGRGDRGAWDSPPRAVKGAWESLRTGYRAVVAKHPKLERKAEPHMQLGTLGSGNHFVEVCLDESQDVWVMLHSGSRGVGNRIGTYFIEMARQDMRRHQVNLPDRDLAYLSEGSSVFDDYVEAVSWAQQFASVNRQVMMDATVRALRGALGLAHSAARANDASRELTVVNCHHNYIARERHFEQEVWVTRKGAVRAGEGDFGIIPGSMGARSFIVKGRGNRQSFESCSHGAGRLMSRTAAKKKFSVADHVAATEGIECRKDKAVIDETPAAYKDIEAVMRAQSELVDVVHELRQVVCVKG